MKKVILSLVFVFVTALSINANDSIEKNSPDSCLEEAWEFGSEFGGGDEFEEWYWTNEYYEVFCEGEDEWIE